MKTTNGTYCTECKKAVGSKLKHKLQKWGAEGWEVISCIVPDPRNFSTYRIVAKRRTGSKYIGGANDAGSTD